MISEISFRHLFFCRGIIYHVSYRHSKS